MDPQALRTEYWKLAAAAIDVVKAWEYWQQNGEAEAEEKLNDAMDALAREAIFRPEAFGKGTEKDVDHGKG